MQLPPSLRQSLTDIIATSPSAFVSSAAKNLSERYRRLSDKNKGSLQIQSKAEALSYLAFRFPATYCAVTSVLQQAQQIIPNLKLTSLLDAGAGPATATLAALHFWPQLEHCHLIEPNDYLRAVGTQLLKENNRTASTLWTSQPLHPPGTTDIEIHDAVIMSYMLNEIVEELGERALVETIQQMWEQTAKLLIILEPGTPFGQKTILRARDLLLSLGGHLAAPCPHDQSCPIATQFKDTERWCHFSVRVERSKLHKAIKQEATLGYEDEKFSYLIFTKEKTDRPTGRIIGHPRGTKVIQGELCCSDGTVKKLTLSASSPHYKKFRSASWGDIWN